jgi:hypothetical protein
MAVIGSNESISRPPGMSGCQPRGWHKRLVFFFSRGAHGLRLSAPRLREPNSGFLPRSPADRAKGTCATLVAQDPAGQRGSRLASLILKSVPESCSLFCGMRSDQKYCTLGLVLPSATGASFPRALPPGTDFRAFCPDRGARRSAQTFAPSGFAPRAWRGGLARGAKP